GTAVAEQPTIDQARPFRAERTWRLVSTRRAPHLGGVLMSRQRALPEAWLLLPALHLGFVVLWGSAAGGSGASKEDKEAREFLEAAFKEELLQNFAKGPIVLPPHDNVQQKRHEIRAFGQRVVFLETWGERVKAEARFLDPEKQLQVKIPALKRPRKDQLEFTLDMSAPLAVTARGSHFPRVPRSTIEVQGEAEGVVHVRLDADCTATLRKQGAKTEIDIRPKGKLRIEKLRLTKVKVNRVGNIGGDPARILGSLFEGVIQREIGNKRAQLENAANAALAKATVRPRVNTLMLEL